MRLKPGVKTIATVLSIMACALSSGGFRFANSARMNGNEGPTKKGVVYVCACLTNKSCYCMTEAKAEGPCACGTKGGPPLKAVPSDSDWAKENRDALSK
ncbi:MAG TPA: hypothetical protein VE998_08035 [Terriglobales bacterium]|nr:hypothetical protein [Terriglobales bacterium]